MKQFNGYQLKIYEDKTEIYKNNKLIATEDNEEKAKSYIMKELKKEESRE